MKPHPSAKEAFNKKYKETLEHNARELGKGIVSEMGKREHADLDLIRSLIKLGADVNACNDRKHTILMFASEFGHLDIMKMLLDGGADIQAESCWGYTPLFWAVSGYKKEAAGLLLKRGADVHIGDSQKKQTPLHVAAVFDADAIPKMLLAHGAEVNARDAQGNTPLMEAVHNSFIFGTEGNIRLLIEKGADLNVKNDKGEDAVFRADAAALRLLLAAGAPLDSEAALRAVGKEEAANMIAIERARRIEEIAQAVRTPQIVAPQSALRPKRHR